MDPHSALQIPDPAIPGPSRPTRATSIAVQPNSSQSQTSPRKTRASHAVVSSQEQRQQQIADQPAYHDVYSHPAAVAYAAAHPRRQIPKFGPYLLLQTLGEGEFGKVKLGLHSQWGEEVAVKLIRRGSIDTTVRMGKVEREIEVLRTLKHPNIVRLYEVIETDKYIGIIIEYASGGELFDHILAHRYLKERDAAKLFSQLISGVWYIHQKKIVHRDLKLENLLLDRHRDVIITDFGFANRFEHRTDDLMQTSCGSPCYAAPELVISEGLYVGSAVDIWSCGVILYAMLAGYLPFDDDPANPDGDNINLLYKYIVNTPLSFPDYVSAEARELLSMMLVPDPARRADLASVMAHPWLAAYAHVFEQSVDELEHAAMNQQQRKRLAYQKQMKQAAAAADSKVSRSQSAKSADPFGGKSRAHHQQASVQPDFLYETSGDGAHRNAVVISSSTAHVPLDDNPFGPSVPRTVSPTNDVTDGVRGEPRPRRSRDEGGHRTRKGSTPSSETKKKGVGRHTIQVEYDDLHQEGQQPSLPTPPRRSASTRRETEDEQMAILEGRGTPRTRERTPSHTSPSSPTHERAKAIVKPPQSGATKPLPATPSSPAPVQLQQDIQISSSPPSAVSDPTAVPVQSGTGSTGSRSSKQSHRRGLSMDKIGFGKIFGIGSNQDQPNGSRIPSEKSAVASPSLEDSARPIPKKLRNNVTPKASSKNSLLNPGEEEKTSRRNTLTAMVEPFRIRRGKSKVVATDADTPSKEKGKEKLEPQSAILPSSRSYIPGTDPSHPNTSNSDFGEMGMPASTNKARKVMKWFRTRSKGRLPADFDDAILDGLDPTPTQAHYTHAAAGSFNTLDTQVMSPVQVYVTPSDQIHASGHPKRSTSTATDASLIPVSLATRVRRSVGLPPSSKAVLRIHHGAVDTNTITTRPPLEVMKHVRAVLVEMGVEITHESDYKFRCVRPKRKKTGTSIVQGINNSPSGGGVAAINMVGSAASNGVDKRGLPIPGHPSFSATGGMLKGLLMRRQSSQVSTSSAFEDDPTASPVSTSGGNSPLAEPAHDPIYGDPATDAGDEVRFSVELTRLDRLQDTFSLDIRRLKGNLRSYKFLYDTLRQRADLQREITSR